MSKGVAFSGVALSKGKEGIREIEGRLGGRLSPTEEGVPFAVW